jgi:hypothetical protein
VKKGGKEGREEDCEEERKEGRMEGWKEGRKGNTWKSSSVTSCSFSSKARTTTFPTKNRRPSLGGKEGRKEGRKDVKDGKISR